MKAPSPCLRDFLRELFSEQYSCLSFHPYSFLSMKRVSYLIRKLGRRFWACSTQLLPG